ncbi:hypothetical protein Tco_0006570 [Tanacetum coccineum]
MPILKDEGIEHQTSTLEHSEQNGVSKDGHRTLVEAARTMLSALASHYHYGEAVATLAVLRTDHSSNPHMEDRHITSLMTGTLMPRSSRPKRRQIMNNSDRAPRQHVVPSQKKNIFVKSKAPNASFQEDEFINPFCTRVQEIGESSSRNIDNSDVHSFQPQSHDFRWTKDHPLEQVRGNPTMPVQTRRQLATLSLKCVMFALTIDYNAKVVYGRTMMDERSDCNSQQSTTFAKGLLRKRDSGLNNSISQTMIMPDALILRKSTSGEIRFLGDKLVRWMSNETKLHCNVSSAEAEYVALSASCCSLTITFSSMVGSNLSS